MHYRTCSVGAAGCAAPDGPVCLGLCMLCPCMYVCKSQATTPLLSTHIRARAQHVGPGAHRPCDKQPAAVGLVGLRQSLMRRLLWTLCNNKSVGPCCFFNWNFFPACGTPSTLHTSYQWARMTCYVCVSVCCLCCLRLLSRPTPASTGTR